MDFSPSTLTQGSTPTVVDVLRDDAGNPVDLTGATVTFTFQGGCGTPVINQVRPAVITDPVNGGVSYTFLPDDLDNRGAYLGQWTVTFPDTTVLIYPPARGVFQATPNAVLMKWPDGTWHEVLRTIQAGQNQYAGQNFFQFEVNQTPVTIGGWIEFTVISGLNVTLLGDLYETIRAILGDIYEEKMYSDCALASVVRSVVKCGQINQRMMFKITPDNRAISPALPDPATLGLCVYLAAKMILLPNTASSSWKIRAFGESMGRQQDFIFALENILYDLQNPNGGLNTFQNFYGWVNATVGLNIYALMTDMLTTGSVATVSIGRSGLQVNATI